MGWGPVEWVGRVLSKARFKKNAPRFWIFLDLSDRYSPVLWRPPKSQNPYNVKPFLTDISVTVAQIQKIQKTRCIFFSNFASGRTLPTHSIGPQPIQLVPKHCFYRYIGNGGSNQKK